MKEIPQLRTWNSWTFTTPKTKWKTISFNGSTKKVPYGELTKEFHVKRINFIATDGQWHKMEECFDFGRTWIKLKKHFGCDPLVPAGFLTRQIKQGVRVYLPAYVGDRVPLLVSDDATFYPDANPESTSVDGLVKFYSADVSWSTLVAGAGSGATDIGTNFHVCNMYRSTVENKWSQLERGIVLFDVSSLSGETVSATTFSVHGYDKSDDLSITPNINVYSSAPASNTVLAAGDYDSLGTSAYCDTAITYAGFSASAYNDFIINSTGITFIQTAVDGDGIVKFGIRNVNYDVADELDPGNHDPSWSLNSSYIKIDGAETANTTSDPKLFVTYGAGGGATTGFFHYFN